MPRNHQSIRMIAESLTDDPDYSRSNPRYFTEDADALLTEAINEAMWGMFGSKTKKLPPHPLKSLVTPQYVKQLAQQRFRGDTKQALAQAMEDINLEYKNFVRMNKIQDDDEAMREFIAYKQDKKLPVRKGGKDPREIENQGGSDWRNDDRAPKESRRRGRRGILK